MTDQEISGALIKISIRVFTMGLDDFTNFLNKTNEQFEAIKKTAEDDPTLAGRNFQRLKACVAQLITWDE